MYPPTQRAPDPKYKPDSDLATGNDTSDDDEALQKAEAKHTKAGELRRRTALEKQEKSSSTSLFFGKAFAAFDAPVKDFENAKED